MKKVAGGGSPKLSVPGRVPRFSRSPDDQESVEIDIIINRGESLTLSTISLDSLDEIVSECG